MSSARPPYTMLTDEGHADDIPTAACTTLSRRVRRGHPASLLVAPEEVDDPVDPPRARARSRRRPLDHADKHQV
jgi:hypothetical protein